MLEGFPAFCGYSTNDIIASRDFYCEKLGLSAEIRGNRFLHLQLSTSQTVVIYWKPDHVPPSHTVLNFQVTDIETVVDRLSVIGIQFMQLDPFHTDAKGISWDDQGSHLAWFRDPAGNIIALIEH